MSQMHVVQARPQILVSDHRCPSCKEGVLHRSKRRGFKEEHFDSWFGWFPWRCARCKKRIRLKDRGNH